MISAREQRQECLAAQERIAEHHQAVEAILAGDPTTGDLLSHTTAAAQQQAHLCTLVGAQVAFTLLAPGKRMTSAR